MSRSVQASLFSTAFWTAVLVLWILTEFNLIILFASGIPFLLLMIGWFTPASGKPDLTAFTVLTVGSMFYVYLTAILVVGVVGFIEGSGCATSDSGCSSVGLTLLYGGTASLTHLLCCWSVLRKDFDDL